MSVLSGAGGRAVLRPASRGAWTASFGSLIPCITDGGSATIDAVRYDVTVEPVSVETGVREHPTEQGGLIAMVRGRPDVGPYAVEKWWHPTAAGWSVTDSCDGESANRAEMITVMRASSAGARIDKTYVDYSTDDGARYTLVVGWKDVMCGTRTHDAGCG